MARAIVVTLLISPLAMACGVGMVLGWMAARSTERARKRPHAYGDGWLETQKPDEPAGRWAN